MLGNYSRPTRHYPAPRPEDTLVVMAKLIQKGQYDARLRLLTETIIADLQPHDYLSEYLAVLNWVRKNVRYSRDPRTIEQVKTPDVTLETRTGDCDDLSVLIGSMVGQIGAQLRLVAGGFRDGARHPQTGEPILAHVWLEAFEPNVKAWVVLDPVPGRKVHQMLGRLKRTTVYPVQ